MISVILANGDGQRFRDAGYKTPKHLLEIDGVPIASIIAQQVPATSDILVVTRHDYVAETVEKTGLPVVGLGNKKSPLLDLLDALSPTVQGDILVNYCDCWMDSYITFIEGCKRNKFDAGVVAFSSKDSRHKQLVKGMAFGGIYWFKNYETLLSGATAVTVSNPCVLDAARMLGHTIHSAYGYVDVGVPEDYEKCQLQLKSI